MNAFRTFTSFDTDRSVSVAPAHVAYVADYSEFVRIGFVGGGFVDVAHLTAAQVLEAVS